MAESFTPQTLTVEVPMVGGLPDTRSYEATVAAGTSSERRFDELGREIPAGVMEFVHPDTNIQRSASAENQSIRTSPTSTETRSVPLDVMPTVTGLTESYPGPVQATHDEVFREGRYGEEPLVARSDEAVSAARQHVDFGFPEGSPLPDDEASVR